MWKEHLRLLACFAVALAINGLALLFCEWGSELEATPPVMLAFATIGFASIEMAMLRGVWAVHVFTNAEMKALSMSPFRQAIASPLDRKNQSD
jgi:hypothetical protein